MLINKYKDPRKECWGQSLKFLVTPLGGCSYTSYLIFLTIKTRCSISEQGHEYYSQINLAGIIFVYMSKNLTLGYASQKIIKRFSM